MERADVTFDSSGDRCAAWLYLPDGVDVPRPCVVLAHGWSGIREARLDAYAERFAAAGLAALVFDYRYFGASEGEPRQLLDIRRQLEDWAAAVAYARSLGGVDADRVALWGTSFSGGHVIETAARDGRVAAVVAQMPYVDGLRNLPRLGIRHSLRLTVEGVKDEIDRLRGRPPRMLKSVGPPGSLAIMTSPDAEPGFRRLIPPDVRWIDDTAGRIVLRVATHRRSAGHVRSGAQSFSASSTTTSSRPRTSRSRRPTRRPGARCAVTRAATSTRTAASSSSASSRIRSTSSRVTC